MSRRTITHLYAANDDAVLTVRDLASAGIAEADISSVTSISAMRPLKSPRLQTRTSRAWIGVLFGTVIGGDAGLLASFGQFSLPGFDRIVAAGLLPAMTVGAVIGAVAGGLISRLMYLGVHHGDHQSYAGYVPAAATLVTVQTDDARFTSIETIMQRHNPEDAVAINARRENIWSHLDQKTKTELGHDRNTS